jgi:hypothetical protein
MAIFVKVTDENIHGMYVQTEKKSLWFSLVHTNF